MCIKKPEVSADFESVEKVGKWNQIKSMKNYVFDFYYFVRKFYDTHIKFLKVTIFCLYISTFC